MAAIRTELGPVGLRPPRRKKETISVEGVGQKTIQKGWLKGQSAESTYYRKAVLQAMLLAAQDMKVADADDPKPLVTSQEADDARKRRVNLQSGREKITLAVAKKRGLTKVERSDRQHRDELVKFTGKCPCRERMRKFVLSNADKPELIVYRNDKPTSRSTVYDMSNAEAVVETRSSAQYPKWKVGYNARLRVDFPERLTLHKGPVYLYSTDLRNNDAKVNRWKSAFLMSRVLTSGNDRRALKVSIIRAASAALNKGWESLVFYSKEVKATKALVKTMSMRLQQVELSRGYTKMRLAYKNHLEALQRRKDQQIWAARFMSKKMANLSNQKAKSAADVRENLISKVQQNFRRYRVARIFDRTYPLSSSTVERLTQAKLGSRIDLAVNSLASEVALKFYLNGTLTLQTIERIPDVFKTKKSTYSEVSLPVGNWHVYVSDNLTSLSFSNSDVTSNENTDDYAALSKADWSKFVNLDRIGSVILHSEPSAGASLPPREGAVDEGVWFTINGPRLAVCKKADAAEKSSIDPFEVAEALSLKKQVLWAVFDVSIGSVTLPSSVKRTECLAHALGYTFRSEPMQGQVGQSSLCAQAQYTFGKATSFEVGVPIAKAEKGLNILELDSIGVLEGTEVAVEVFNITPEQPRELLYIGTMPLTEVFGLSQKQLLDKIKQGQIDDSSKQLKLLPQFSKITARSSTCCVNRHADDATKRLSEASVTINVKAKFGMAESAKFQNEQVQTGIPKFLGDRQVVSPEFVGLGMPTTLFTSHRGAWYDPYLGPGKFRSEHVANFAVICIKGLRFLNETGTDEGKRYRIKASIGPVSASTAYLTRPKAGWSEVIGPVAGDTKVIQFGGHRLCVPLPPGCWSPSTSEDGTSVEKRKIWIKVYVVDEKEFEPMDHKQFITSSNKAPSGKVTEKVVYSGSVNFDNMTVDLDKKNVSIFLGPTSSKEVAENDLLHGSYECKDPGASLTVDFAMRDRDYVKAATGQPLEMRAICVGDKAMLVVEEPIVYPATNEEFRRRFMKDEAKLAEPNKARKDGKPPSANWDSDKCKECTKNGGLWPLDKNGRSYKLRSPCLSSEYAMSGLGDLGQREQFVQSFIPNFCSDVMPHTFILPTTEADFQRRKCPGIFSKIVDEMKAAPPTNQQVSRNDKTLKPKVEYLSSTTKKIAVTVLATYVSSGVGACECDLEIDQDFLEMWKSNRSRRFKLPGQVVLSNDGKRALLKRVPMMYLNAVHTASFHVYDALCKTVDDSFKAPNPTNGFDPRGGLVGQARAKGEDFYLLDYGVNSDKRPKEYSPSALEELERANQAFRTELSDQFKAMGVSDEKGGLLEQVRITIGEGGRMAEVRGQTAAVAELRALSMKDLAKHTSRGTKPELLQDLPFSVASGPLPTDASSAACTFEWSVRMRASNEREMHEFVSMLRRCVRLDNFQQASKMMEYQKRAEAEADPATLASRSLLQRPLYGGQLDVLLVEARRLNIKPMSAHQQAANLVKGPVADMWPTEYLPKLAGTTNGEASRSTPQCKPTNIFVNFKMINQRQDTSGELINEIVPYRGQKVQSSPTLSGSDSPSWAADMIQQGGHLFHTGIINPDKMPQLVMELEVMEQTMFGNSRIGVIQVPVTEKRYLTNPENPFKNLWLPIVSLHKDGDTLPNATGEVHIMCRWLPSEKIPMLPNGTLNMSQVSVRSMYKKEIWPRVVQQRLREPIYNLEVQYLHYNPNLVRRTPESPKDHIFRHAQELCNALPYLSCIERRQTQAWDRFESENGDLAGARLGEVRLQWLQQDNVAKLAKLQGLIFGGIPSQKRAKLWAELTMASRVMEKDGAGGGGRRGETGERGRKLGDAEYQNLLRVTTEKRSDPMSQLQEDCFAMAAWETSVPQVPELIDEHLRRISKAQNVCSALIVLPDGGVSYCESLLVIAFFLLLPQGNREERSLDDKALHWMTESEAFWLLYTLICTGSNGTYKEYFGSNARGTVAKGDGVGGAMEDVNLLDCCFAYHRPEVWQHMNALGFQLSSIFYGAFMRLFATYMPTSSVFRLWDILFAQSTDTKAQPHARSHLIDFAFGLLMTRCADLMQCESAQEVRDLILGALGAMFDMATVGDLIKLANNYLWGGTGYGVSKIAYMFKQREDAFREVNNAVAKQNEVLKVLCQDIKLIIKPTQFEGRLERGISILEVMKDLKPVLDSFFKSCVEDSKAKRPFNAEIVTMHRPLPLCSKLLFETVADQTWHMLEQNLKVKPMPIRPWLLKRPKGAHYIGGVESAGITQVEFKKCFERDVEKWKGSADALYEAFSNGPAAAPVVSHQPLWQSKLLQALGMDDESNKMLTRIKQDSDVGSFVSLNEIFMGLILWSRGTVGEKAAALFSLFSCNVVSPEVYHINPVSQIAISIAREGNAGEKSVAPPEAPDVEAKRNALKFTVKTNYGAKNTLVGVAYIPTLGAFLKQGTWEPESQKFNVWGELGANQRRNRAQPANNNEAPHTLAYKCVAELDIAISWMPGLAKSSSQAQSSEYEEGQLMLHLKSIRFYDMYVTDYYKLNPFIEVCTFDKEGNPQKIKRWEPRGLVSRDGQQSFLNTHGAYGGDMHFDSPMKDSMFVKQGEGFGKYYRDANGMGYNQDKKGEWLWNEVWGKQHSAENTKILKELTKVRSDRNVIDLQAARYITANILRRSMTPVSNRQAVLYADAIFSRSGAIPGIIEAFLVYGQDDKDVAKAWKAKADGKVIDVTTQLALEHERQIQDNGGFLSLFSKEYLDAKFGTTKSLTLRDIGIKGYSGDQVLWVRYIRSCDGERKVKAIKIGSDGSFPTANSQVDLELIDQTPQSKVTKEEFISCLLNNPLLSESMRRLGGAGEQLTPERCVNLDVTIVDPHQEDEARAFMDVITVGQSLLFEVWDKDLSGQDFLGECWLPPLSEFTSGQKKDFVLPLLAANTDPDAERGTTRLDKNKEIRDTATEADKKVTGDLYVSAEWTFPSHPLDDANLDDLEKRAEAQEALHKGKLKLWIHKATNLRKADKRQGKQCDPQVSVYVRNDHLMKWRTTYLTRTRAKTGRNPIFNHEDTHELFTADWESRYPPPEGFMSEIGAMFQSSRTRELKREQHNLTAVQRYGDAGLKITFSDGEPPVQPTTTSSSAREPAAKRQGPGDNHKVKVYMSDSIREFKAKLTTACLEEHQALKKSEGDASPNAAMYKDIDIGYKHLVMVFVAPPKVRKLQNSNMQSSEEYKRAYQNALLDPSSWQPLDPARTFNHYPQFNFGRKPSKTNEVPLIRVIEATETYKLTNLRYKAFHAEMNKNNYFDKNDQTEAYGWAKYRHEDGATSEPFEEWRPCFASMPKASMASPGQTGGQNQSVFADKYMVRWCFPPATKDQKPSAPDKTDTRVEKPKKDVMLAPRMVQMDSYIHPDHEPLLEQAKILRQGGKSDFDIEMELSKQLKVKWEQNMKNDSSAEKPPAITVDIIRSYIMREEMKATTAK